MGSSHSNYNEFSHESLKNFEKHFKKVKDLKDPRFGNVQVFKEKGNKQNEYVMLSDYLLNGEEDLNKFHREVKLRQKLDHPNILKIYGFHKIAKENLCGHINEMTMYSEWHEHDLETELQRRSKHEEYMSEPELWYLADSTISACAYLQERDINHGDLRPMNVLLSNEGLVKLGDHGIVNEEKNNYYKAITGEAKTYLSPELMKNYAKKKNAPNYNVYKADVYSLGLSLLGASILYNPGQIYDWTKKEIKFDIVNDFLGQNEKRYSQNLNQLLRAMLEEDTNSRPDFLSLYRGTGFNQQQQQAMNFNQPQVIGQPFNQTQIPTLLSQYPSQIPQQISQQLPQQRQSSSPLKSQPFDQKPQSQSFVPMNRPNEDFNQNQPPFNSQIIRGPLVSNSNIPPFLQNQGPMIGSPQGGVISSSTVIQGPVIQGGFNQSQFPNNQIYQNGGKIGQSVFSSVPLHTNQLPQQSTIGNQELDRRVADAIKNTEDTIKRNQLLPNFK